MFSSRNYYLNVEHEMSTLFSDKNKIFNYFTWFIDNQMKLLSINW